MTTIVDIDAELLNSNLTIHFGRNMHIYIETKYSHKKISHPKVADCYRLGQ